MIINNNKFKKEFKSEFREIIARILFEKCEPSLCMIKPERR